MLRRAAECLAAIVVTLLAFAAFWLIGVAVIWGALLWYRASQYL